MKYVERFQNSASYCISPSCTKHPFTPASLIPQSDPSSVKLALVMPRKCVNSTDNFCYVAVKLVCKIKKDHHRESGKGRIICISDARWATKTNPGPRTYAAVNVQQIFRSG
jgi:hypothetical protein